MCRESVTPARFNQCPSGTTVACQRNRSLLSAFTATVFARHQTKISHKLFGRFETAVQVVERWILARLRYHTFFCLSELNTAIRQLLQEMNARPLQRQKVSRWDLFETLDRPALRPLPSTPYEYAQWKKAKVSIDYHIEFNRRLYSVPHALVGEVVELRITATLITVLHRGKQVALHQRHGSGRFSTQPHHMPESHRRHSEWSPHR
uniref:Transposase for insertion sequence element IS21-like C-terminal domain-containing protein n=1 Tax=Candidatus Kentrum sp. SD TaxID=2126332 RepID=A0A451BSW6_9GAMM|nr:MAG: hypothetical protein BECKSD772D_GA0070982_13002 [Candidatus Kentron sp. SD]